MTPDGRAQLRLAIDRAVGVLTAAGVPSPRADAMALAAHALGVPQLVLAMAPAVLPDGFADAYAELVERRRRREPLQQILGFAAFRQVSLRMAPGVFVPRPETELVAGAAIDFARTLDRPAVVVDLCSGSGAIAVSVDVEVPGVLVTAVEVDPSAAELTRANLDTLASPRARVVEADIAAVGLLADLDGRVDVVVSNPPYIPAADVPADPEVRDHDPARALYGGGADGLEVPRVVVAVAARLLRPDGLLVMEHADEQGASVRALVEQTGAFEAVETHRDLADRDRYVTARRGSAHLDRRF